MKKPIFILVIFAVFFSALSAQERVKPKREKGEETGKAGVIKHQPTLGKKTPVVRTQLHRPAPTKMGGGNFSVLSNEYLGFGASYEVNRHTRFGFGLNFYYFSIPDDRLYFDPYYYEFVQRNKGSMIMMFLGFKAGLPLFKEEPNINPYLLAGVGPVLGIENNQRKSFPGSVFNAHSVGGVAGYSGVGVEYRINAWALNFDIRYQMTRFPNEVLNTKEFDGMMFNIGVGKLF